ncbi:hypothetical protein FOXB_00886 [Fusarium oxysporum f. sp. conglutinans Fo5176]|uniref:Uncharacterized protein n=1 Tax=Fusarium oxysporum (strain Fo5176) TaxID=660025 RepID=F9F3B1_FUSOF|nr:hypothetical protein FOXB_00886 [Fusarium oxysporum f. sp. conglutinans Fo5176]
MAIMLPPMQSSYTVDASIRTPPLIGPFDKFK